MMRRQSERSLRMGPKLAELRKMLLQSESPNLQAEPSRGASGPIFLRSLNRHGQLDGEDEAQASAHDEPFAFSDKEAAFEPEAGPTHLEHVDDAPKLEDGPRMHNPPGTGASRGDAARAGEIASAIEGLFEPARRCRENLRQISALCESAGQVINSAAESNVSLQRLGENLQRVAKAFLSMRAFRDETSAAAEVFEPLQRLTTQVALFENAVREEIAAFARELGCAAKLKAQIAEIEHSVASIGEFETQFAEILHAFENSRAGAGPGLSEVIQQS